MSVETQLRHALHVAADELGHPEAPVSVRAEGMLALRGRRRRRRAVALCAGLAVLLVTVAVPVGLSLLGSGGSDDRVVSPPTIPDADIYGMPTRGSLAGDTAFVEAVRELPWAGALTEGVPAALDPPLPDPPLETRNVVFAGDVTGARWALVAGQNTVQPTGEAADPDLQTDLGALSDIAGVWFVGPPGATPAQMLLATVPRGISADRPTSLYDAATGALVVVSAPGDVIEISPRPEVAADATVRRTFVDTNSTDGIAVLALDANPYNGPPAPVFRVSRSGMEVLEQGPDGYGDPNQAPAPEIALTYLRPPNSPFAVRGLPLDEQRMAAEILSQYGLRQDQIAFQVHYLGPLPGTSGQLAGLTVLTAIFPSGAVLTRALWLQELDSSLGYFGGGSCAMDDLSAAGVPAAQRIIAMRCDVDAGAENLPDPASTLVVIAPPALAAGSATAQADSGAIRLDLVDGGVGMAPFPEGAETVVVRDGEGAVLEEVPILSY
ncbi:MAG: hypothetical protein ACR2JG_12360 [Geodermatophilaceae bacterium]